MESRVLETDALVLLAAQGAGTFVVGVQHPFALRK